MTETPSLGRRIRVKPDGNDWICLRGKKRRQTGTGFSNLVSHVTAEHADDLREFMKEIHQANRQRLLQVSYSIQRKQLTFMDGLI